MSDLIRLLIEIWAAVWPFRLVRSWQQGVWFVCGRYWRTVGPGCWPVVPFFMELRPVEVVPSIWATPLQAITLRDKRALTYSAMVTVRVEDPAAALNLVDEWPESTLELVSGQLSETLAEVDPEGFDDPSYKKRANLMERIREAADAETRKFGVRVEKVRFNNFAVGVRTVRLLIDRATTADHLTTRAV
ncbi:MAG TPA: SPFH domain-containing protein [Fimbriiglobus sp.]|nr:SPFH domain-containing protein [Fimbriiglobus sp.]